MARVSFQILAPCRGFRRCDHPSALHSSFHQQGFVALVVDEDECKGKIGGEELGTAKRSGKHIPPFHHSCTVQHSHTAIFQDHLARLLCNRIHSCLQVRTDL